MRVGAELEKYMAFGLHDGQFRGRPLPSSADETGGNRRAALRPSVPMASCIVYVTVMAAWAYLAYVGFDQ